MFAENHVGSDLLQLALEVFQIVAVPDDVDGLQLHPVGDLDDGLADGRVGAVLNDLRKKDPSSL